jgi:hypothetical protein
MKTNRGHSIDIFLCLPDFPVFALYSLRISYSTNCAFLAPLFMGYYVSDSDFSKFFSPLQPFFQFPGLR